MTPEINELVKAVEERPEDIRAWHAMAGALKRSGRPDRALQCYETILRIDRENWPAWNNLGNIQKATGNMESAVASYTRALRFNPRLAAAHSNLGNVYRQMDRPEKAVACYRDALAIDPVYAQGWVNMGVALKDLGRSTEAIECFQKALKIDSGHVGACGNMGNAYKEQGRYDDAIVCYREALARDPEAVGAYSNMLYCMNNDPAYGPREHFKAADRWWRRYGADLSRPEEYSNTPQPDRRLRIGYVSPDFRQHSVSYFFKPLIRAHDRRRFELFCYSDTTRPDGITAEIRAACDHWINAVGMEDRALADRIVRDRIDILVDLAGHSAGNRLLVFARQPAPVQVAWLGYANTTGIPRIHYRLTDDIADPPGDADQYHAEELVRLPGGFLCYEPIGNGPEPGPLPGGREGFITFGSFNNLAKINPCVVQTWAAIMKRVPRSKLLLKSRQLADETVRARYRNMFAEQDLEPDRIEMAVFTPTAGEHMAMYNRVDIALDPFPYNGTTTTFDAFRMGVPVIALAGDRHAARVGADILARVGHPELVAEDEQRYVEIAANLAADPGRLEDLRGRLRRELADSGLCDADVFSRGLERAFRKLWKRWCRREGAENRAGDVKMRIVSTGEPVLKVGRHATFKRLDSHTGGMVLKGSSVDGKFFIKIEIHHDSGKANSLEEEAGIMTFLNRKGCISCPQVVAHGCLDRRRIESLLDDRQRKVLDRVKQTEFPFILQQFVPAAAGVTLPDMLLSYIEQKSLGIYQGDPRPDNLRFDEVRGVCCLIDYDQAEYLPPEVVAMDNLAFLEWCAGRSREKYGFASLWHYFPEMDFDRHVRPLFRGHAFDLGSTTLYRRQRTTLMPCGIYHSLNDDRLYAGGERDIQARTRLLDGIDFTAGERVLDVGCNAGLMSLYLCDRGCRVTGMDLDRSIVTGARFIANILGRRIDYHCIDLDKDPLPGSYDTVMLFSVIHHTKRMHANARRIADCCRRIIIECRLVEHGAKPEQEKWVRTSNWEYRSTKEMITGLEKLFPGFFLKANHGRVDRERYILEFVRA